MNIKIEDTKLLKILNDKKNQADKAVKTTKEMQKLEKEYNKLVSKIKRLDEKSRPLIKKYIQDVNMGEFEEISRVFNEDGGWEIEIVDRLEQFKKQYKEMKENEKSGHNNSKRQG